MKLKLLTVMKPRQVRAILPVLVVGIMLMTGAVLYNLNAHAATTGFYFTAPASTYKVGDTFDVAVYEGSGTQCANVIQADFTYPANLLRYNSSSATGSKYESVLQSNSGNGSVSMQQYTTRKECGSGSSATSGVSGEQLIGHISFTVLGTGTATLSFGNSSIAISSADNKTNVAPGSIVKSFVLATATSQPPATPAPTTSTPAPKPAATSAPTTRTATKPVTSVTPTGADTPIALDNNDVIQLQTPADVHPLPIQPDGVNKIEYYLDNKLVATVKTEPYTYHLDTSELINGKHTLTTKTYYSNGQMKSVSQIVVADNPFGWTQFVLSMKKFAWLIVLLVMLIGAAVVTWIIHRRGGTPTDYFDGGTRDDTADVVVSPPSDSMITPSNPSTPMTTTIGGANTSQPYVLGQFDEHSDNKVSTATSVSSPEATINPKPSFSASPPVNPTATPTFDLRQPTSQLQSPTRNSVDQTPPVAQTPLQAQPLSSNLRPNPNTIHPTISPSRYV